jgi:hypothetical protein
LAVPIDGTRAGEPVAHLQLSGLRAAADQVQIVGARYPEENDRMTNLEAPLPPE